MEREQKGQGGFTSLLKKKFLLQKKKRVFLQSAPKWVDIAVNEGDEHHGKLRFKSQQRKNMLEGGSRYLAE